MSECEKALDQISLDLDGELSPEERQALEAHLAVCPACAALARDLRALHRAMPELEEAPPEGFHQSVMDQIRREQVRPVPAPQRAGAVPWRRWASLAAVLAVVLVGAASLGKPWGGDTGASAPEAALEAATAEGAASGGDAAAGQEPKLFSASGGEGQEAAPRDAEPETVGTTQANVAADAAPEEALPTSAPMGALPANGALLSEEDRAALSASCAAWLQSSGFDQAEAIDTALLTVEAVDQGDLEAALCPDEALRPLLDLGDYRVTVGDPSGFACALLLCDSETLEVLGYLPTE